MESKSPVASPVLNEESSQFGFDKVVTNVLLGKKVHKLEWKDKEFYAVVDDVILKLHKPDGKLYSWIISTGDLEGDDYIVIT